MTDFGYVYFKDPARQSLYVTTVNDIGHINEEEQILGHEDYYRKILSSDHEMKICSLKFDEKCLTTKVIASGVFNKPVDKILRSLTREEQCEMFDSFYDQYVETFKSNN